MIDNTFYVASMLLYFRDKYYYLYAEWRGVDVEDNARCGVAIMAQVYGIDAANLQSYINLVNQQQANIAFDFIVDALRAGSDYFDPQIDWRGIRPVVRLTFRDENQQIFSMHAISNDGASSIQLSNFVTLLNNAGERNFIIGGDFNHEPNIQGNIAQYGGLRNVNVVRSGQPTQGLREGDLQRELDYFIAKQEIGEVQAIGTLRRDDGNGIYIGEVLSDHIIVYTVLTTG